MSARLVTALAVGIGLLAGPGAGAAVAAPCDPAPAGNPVACENSKPGTPESVWNIQGAGDPSIQGFATDISVNVGATVHFKIATSATAYKIDIYRIGYYAGNGARLQATIPSVTGQSQPACARDSSTGLVDCGNWAESASWAVPADAVSGVYIAHLVRADGAGESHIPFVVRNDDSHSALLFQTSDTTWQAYNQYGGNSLYVGGADAPGSNPTRAYKVSYNRPITTRGDGPEDAFFNAEYPMVRWLERNGYDVSYMSGVDSDRLGARITQHRTFLSVGHDEYWSGNQRGNVEAARDAGTNLAFLSGNEVFWKTRWEQGGDGTPYRTLVCYKDTHSAMKLDQSGAWTGTWRDPRGAAYDAGRPENALTGQLFRVNYGTTAITVPAQYGKLPLWRNTDIATLSPGSEALLPTGTLGYEWDENFNGSQPPGSIDLSSTTLSGAQILEDAGSTYGDGDATHHLNLYRAGSGAFVFGAGTVQWSWGLDAFHDRDTVPTDLRMQQATANLLADLGAQAATLQSGVVAPTPMNPMTGGAPPPPPPTAPQPPPPVLPAPRGEPSARPSAPTTGASASSAKDGGSATSANGSSGGSTAGCLKLTSTVKRMRTGKRTALTATVRRSGGPAAGVRVVLSGNGTSVVRRSDRHGRVRFVVRPRHAGTLRLRVPSQRSSCKAAVASVRVR